MGYSPPAAISSRSGCSPPTDKESFRGIRRGNRFSGGAPTLVPCSGRAASRCRAACAAHSRSARSSFASTPSSSTSWRPAPNRAVTAAALGSRRRWRRPMAVCIALGWAHSFETWQHGRLVGGLYGVAIGRAFFGESMFTRVTDASKVALAHAVELLAHSRHGGHRLPSRFGAYAEPRRRRYSANAVPVAHRRTVRRMRTAADVAFRLIRPFAAFPPLVQQCAASRGLPTVAEWQKKKQFKWKVR